jgi:hypothetical protein
MWLKQLPIFYYLIPAISLALLIRWNCHSFRLFAAFVFVGVVLHETLHLVTGAVLGAKPVGMSVIPRRGRQGTMELGSVCFSNITWYNALPLALAPLIGLPMAVAAAHWRVSAGWTLQWVDVPIWMALASVFLSCWPSLTDWRISLRSWPIYFGVIGFFAWPHLPFA